ncbi:MAG: LpxI family protein [Rhizobiaceae bacterium]
MNQNTPEFTPGNPLAIIAGNGNLPLQIAESLVARNQHVFVVGIRGEASREIEQFPHEWCDWERIGYLFKILRQRGTTHLAMAGGVVGRPELRIHKMDWLAIRTLPGILAALLGGDNKILSNVISIVEKHGFTVCNVAELLPELTVGKGAITSNKPSKADQKRIAEGFAVTNALGKFDIGQGCVVLGNRAVAVEGAEGTDGMLRRVAELRTIGRLPRKRGGVLVKSVKPGQDERADLPAIGPDTIMAVERAGLMGIGVQASKTLVIDREATLQLAKIHKIFVYGFENAVGHDDA